MAIKPVEWPAFSEWRQVLTRTWKEAGDDNVGLLAAGVAFYAFLAFVPLLASVVLTYGLIADPQTVADHIRTLATTLPEDAAGIIGDQLQSITGEKSSAHGIGLAIALGFAFYGASKGSGAVITALNVAYEVEESRGFFKRTLMSLAMTAGLVLVVLIAALAISALGLIESLLPFGSPLVHTVLKLVFWAAAAVAASLGVALVYRFAPNRPDAPWRWITPGSAVATLLWLAATFAFGLYVSNFGNYNATYGSLGGVVIFLTWLYLTAYILLMGGELNSELERQQKCREEQGAAAEQPEPAAQRPEPAPASSASVAAATAETARSTRTPARRERSGRGMALLAGGLVAAGAALLRRMGRRERHEDYFRGPGSLGGQRIATPGDR